MVLDPSSEFVRRFEEVWRAPSVDLHEQLWAPDVELHQPLLGSLHGREECRRAFAKLFVLAPDLTAEVDGYSGAPDSLFISFAFDALVGGARVRWPAVDRFLLDEQGRIRRRDSFFDASTPLVHLARHPGAWPRALRARLIPRRAAPPPWPSPSPSG